MLLLSAESLEIAFTRLHISMPEPQRFYTMRQQLQNRWRKLSQQGAQDELVMTYSQLPQLLQLIQQAALKMRNRVQAVDWWVLLVVEECAVMVRSCSPS